MHLKSVRVRSFQAFADSEEVEFNSGFNLLIGPNNVGKSSFLEALSFPLKDSRHNPATWPRGVELRPPTVDFEIEATGTELLTLFGHSNAQIQFPVERGKHFDQQLIEHIRGTPSIRVTFQRNSNSSVISTRYPSYGHLKFAFDNPHPAKGATAILNGKYGELTFAGVNAGARNDNLPEILEKWLRNNLFLFKAERFAFSVSQSENTTTLQPDARNLPAVLNTLFGNQKKDFDRIIAHVKAIFETVGDITLRTSPNNNSHTEIIVWPSSDGQVGGQGFPLGDCGTGVAQVVSLLTGVSTIESGIFVIDELNAFLHPAASKALIRILSTYYSYHQYIVSSHSPEIFSWHGFDRVYSVRRQGYDSSLKIIDQGDISQVKELASSLGISPSDFFAAENVVWVEGQTEELVFSYIYEASQGPLPASSKFISVVSTGDFFRRRDRELVWQVYQRLSSVNSPLLKSATFSFDSEGLNTKEKGDIVKMSGGNVKFLPRRNIESYFIEAPAIAEVLTESDSQSHTAETIAALINEVAAEPEFSAGWNGKISDKKWLATVDGARLLETVFKRASDSRVTYDKSHHGVLLVKAIHRSEAMGFAELSAHVVSLI